MVGGNTRRHRARDLSDVRGVAGTDLALSVELPLRLHRGPNAQPIRRPEPVPLAEIEAAVRTSLAFVERHLGVTA